uniref:Ubiquitin-like domain-containing protein n=1 Tax=Globodera pallida TaxID=36090 RepID=A0A183C1T9_GLOPA
MVVRKYAGGHLLELKDPSIAALKQIYGQLKIGREKDTSCGPNGRMIYYSPDFSVAPSREHDVKACADKTVWGLFAQKMAAPPSSTPSKAIGVAMPPSAIYVIVVALVLGCFALFLPMICGQ